MGKILILVGVMIAAFGALLWAGERFFGRAGGFLPGDIVLRKGNFTFAFPIVTSIVLSILLSVLLTLAVRFFGGPGGPR